MMGVAAYRKRHEQSVSTAREMIDSGLPDDYPSSLFEDHRGRIWVFSRGGAAYLERGRFVPVSAMPGGFAHAITAEMRAVLVNSFCRPDDTQSVRIELIADTQLRGI